MEVGKEENMSLFFVKILRKKTLLIYILDSTPKHQTIIRAICYISVLNLLIKIPRRMMFESLGRVRTLKQK